MKLVREHINEKFAETSDPIKDMGIGAIDHKGVNWLAKTLQKKLQEMFPHDTIKVATKNVHKDLYSVVIAFKSGYYVTTHFSATHDAPLEFRWAPGVGWNLRHDNVYIDPYDFDALIVGIFDLIFSGKEHAQMSINGQLKKLKKAKKEQERLEKSIETAKIIQQHLK